MAKRERHKPELTRDLSHIIEPLRIWAVDLDTLNLDPENAQFHTETNIAQIKASMKEFGQDEAVLFRCDGRRVFIGNGRLIAARELRDEGDRRWQFIAAFGIDEDMERIAARGVAHNRAGQSSGVDKTALAKLIKRIQERQEFKALLMSDDEKAKLLARIDGGPEKPKPAKPTKWIRFELAAEDHAALIGILEGFDDADRNVAMKHWITEAMKAKATRR